MATNSENFTGLSEIERQAVAVQYLESLKPGFLPAPIFYQTARLAVLHTVEVGFVQPSEQGLRVALTQRPATDRFWANQWHIPGSVVRPDDPVKHEHDHEAAFQRVLDEVGGLKVVGEPIEFDTVRRKGARGSEVTVRLLAVTTGHPERGAFFLAHEVLRQAPAGGLIDSHGAAIEKVAATYAAYFHGH